LNISYTNEQFRTADRRRLLQDTWCAAQCHRPADLSKVDENLFSYRELALANHPALQHPNPNAAYQRFAQAAEAFDVLHDGKKWFYTVEKRQIYDEHGEQRLKEGVLQDGALVGRYRLTTDPEETF
jgi:DnaJ-class molecular chaperone